MHSGSEVKEEDASRLQTAEEGSRKRPRRPSYVSTWYEMPDDTLEELTHYFKSETEKMMTEEGSKTFELPPARLKKVVRSVERKKSAAQELPMMLSKACEMFIYDLTVRSRAIAAGDTRITVQRPDIIAAISKDIAFDFLTDLFTQADEETAKEFEPKTPTNESEQKS
eukprot:TRINITY_DN3767_c0_g1_i1.p1 TRINITY_DN3767_c0_g1~~TRINITY_DN3767_c0_g1_i1.p1  ORF type:complete len:168 (-),score=51.31 TRINITY_DN3767_c0_g1_i1:213-716(-)